ncbi:Trans-acting enoyl reductase [Saliniradius amylolyticus]|uniref:Trans-acting enoyl reductase n=1 Tax=Saliniradius amylolyticus TaxID=2183582 RepID=A0A2S2E2S5_9ALTE|nr:saccharopine dehydrogenase NADP-binding domain-containing protein [Saliniradius amylolyticus]AWL11560.1 Trans-acting enoyl reductase [Saliniradius amylolyticus]
MTESFDIVLFGATSFVGKITARYMAEHYPSADIKWAIAGRSERKLHALKAELPQGNEPEVIIADATDGSALDRLCQQTKVIVSTVGPYAIYGEALVKACVDNGTDYCDLTGEVQFVHKMLKQYEAKARASGARIVHCCGFDSIPSDLGCYFLQQQAKEKYGQPCQRVAMRVARIKGNFSGGTFASMMNVFKDMGKDPSLKKVLSDPYSLCPPDFNDKARQKSVKKYFWDKLSDSWAAPFIMAGVNTRIVLRSAALAPELYGSEFQYHEAMLTGSGAKGKKRASRITMGLGALMLSASVAPLRWILERWILPKPGTGPSPKEQQEGYFRIHLYGRTSSDQELKVEVTGDRDPGYGATAKMLSEAARCVLKDCPKEKQEGGFWTPATLMGEPLIKRLQDNTGIDVRLL